VHARTFKEIRDAFIAFFEQKAHCHLPSSSLVPRKDPTVLLTTAGMLQFKPIFMGAEKPEHSRVVTVQKCFRTTDLDNVGRTARHHTFFQMLGNFSFGDYFKSEVIPWAWEFLTVNLEIPRERLWISVFETDDEAYRIWHEVVGVAAERIVRMGAEDNFWAAGPTGPCGPCSEIYVDLGVEAGNGNPDARLGEDDARFLEVWNLVFMEFNRDEAGQLTPLPAKNIDTGMGLERIASVLQGVRSNYDTDMIQPILQAVAKVAGRTYGDDAKTDVSLKLIADHLRASVFLIADGVVPSNEGRGYVLRRIIRRAFRHGRLIGISEHFLHRQVGTVVGLYGDFYTELVERESLVTETLLEEERRFGQTIDRGMALLDEALAGLSSGSQLDGNTAFELYDTYGFPLDLTLELAHERGIGVDEAGFEQLMVAQRDRARAAREKAGIAFSADAVATAVSRFSGYVGLQGVSEVVDVLDLGAGKTGIVLDETPFYAESGGQVGDTGHLFGVIGNEAEGSGEAVCDTQRRNQAIIHVMSGATGFQVGDRVVARVDGDRRAAIRRHHTATHLLHAALRQVLGTHVTQAGSLVQADGLRFDFTLARAMTDAEIAQVEALVNTEILKNMVVDTAVMDFATARDSGAMALFDEKYGDAVRVLSIGAFSKELCGGTHVASTGEIGLFKVLSESGIAAGVRRIEAVAGLAAYGWAVQTAQTLRVVGDRLKSSLPDIPERLEKLQENLRATEKQLSALQAQLAVARTAALVGAVEEVSGVRFLAAAQMDLTPDALRTAAYSLFEHLNDAVVLLVGVHGGKVSAVALVPDPLIARGVRAGDVLRRFMDEIGGRGSGKANFAQGGGGDATRIDVALKQLKTWLPGILQTVQT
jgi:alanyl-tRNA synthetase